MHLHAQNQQPDYIFYFVAAIVIIVVVITSLARIINIDMPDNGPPPASIPIEGSSWRLFVNEELPPAQEVEANGGLFVKITLDIFHDLNLDGLQGDPELGDHRVRLYNVEDFTDSQLYEEETITDDRVRLCYGLNCKKPDKNGEISFLIPTTVFNNTNTIPITIDYQPGRYVYHTFNQPGTIHGTLEGKQIILSPQFSGGGDIELPTNRIYTDFKIGFSEFPCVLPFDESVVDELLPMNFYDFNPGDGEIINFDGNPPATLQDLDPAFGGYNSRNHTGYDFYYPRMEKIVRYSCLLEPEYQRLSSSELYGNLVFILDPEYGSDEFLLGFGHLQAPDVNTFTGEGLKYGDAFGVIGDKGSSIIHLHYSFGDYAETFIGGNISYCAMPLFPYLGDATEVEELAYGTSQLGDELCFDNFHQTYTVYQVEGDTIYAPFVPSMSIGDQ